MSIILKDRVGALQSICDTILEKGVYSEYAICIEQLSQMLHIDDPAVLNEIMLYVARLGFVKNIQSEYQWCTKGFATLLALEDNNDVVGKCDIDFSLDQTTSDSFQQSVEAVLNGDESVINENVFAFPDGTERALRTRLYAIYGEHDNIIGVLGMAVEVLQPATQQRAAARQQAVNIANPDVSSKTSYVADCEKHL